ncbi:MAG TPA: 50S ribosomal protein L21 [Persephonella sp.]|uniref:Large ribosomal subunit protein bL21 n=1 Tax=Persephonella marina (strain DSM 14350 / EX-H1) TaxID=123214 RepID=RL21_PERMH|nr:MULTISPECIES: 50S ribosomal protein L21 [Persephonella]C0QT34.1 RecName: Full=Large ribosomal subunit protein bL21; AltName: Full=50S ribosomal protein L21 [Persephonella marina EX-H1]ACO03946.1 ribosomal protein L21 [Persephonella marina EX-H1]HCB70532.1 50S ribosomal protein L21 [Persephonella sp.]
MFAVIKTGGKQYRVEPGMLLKVEKLPADVGETVEIEASLIKDDQGNIKTEGKVEAEVVEHGKHKKVLVFHFKRKKNYKKLNGHRQPYTLIKIKDIKA